jgi:hypothetical protein
MLKKQGLAGWVTSEPDDYFYFHDFWALQPALTPIMVFGNAAHLRSFQ